MEIKGTGRTRYRVQTRWFSAPTLVLQIEEKISGEERWRNNGCSIECETLPSRLYWRDATLGDITVGIPK